MAAHPKDQDSCACRLPVEVAVGFAQQRVAEAGEGFVGRMARSTVLAAGMLMAGSALAAGAAAEAPLKADPQAGAVIAEELCAACHAQDGNSIASANPKLAGQHMEYLVKQLKDFKPAEEGKPAARNNAIMLGFASQLSPQDMLNVAAYYSQQKLAPVAARDPELIELGRQIYRGGLPAKGVPACAACHGPAGEGIPAQYPSLYGQFPEYTEAQLVAFRDGTRGNNVPMKDIALRMTDPEIKAVADYIAGLRNQN